MKIWDRERSWPSWFHWVAWMSKRHIESQLVKMSFRPVRRIHIFSVASLLEMSFGIFFLQNFPFNSKSSRSIRTRWHFTSTVISVISNITAPTTQTTVFGIPACHLYDTLLIILSISTFKNSEDTTLPCLTHWKQWCTSPWIWLPRLLNFILWHLICSAKLLQLFFFFSYIH
jgi:hypothetical protein